MTDNLHTLAVLEISKPLPPCRQSTVPSSIALLGPAANFAWEEFFIGRIRNQHTRTVYGRSVRNFLKWADGKGVGIERIRPGIVGAYLDQLSASVPTKKLILAALRGFFDALVLRHVLILNPAASVRAERYEVVEGRTPGITPVQARTLLDSINTAKLSGRNRCATSPCGVQGQFCCGMMEGGHRMTSRQAQDTFDCFAPRSLGGVGPPHARFVASILCDEQAT